MLEPNEDFHQQEIDAHLLDDLGHLVRLSFREDLDRSFDLTTVAVVPEGLPASAVIVARAHGITCGIELIEHIVDVAEADIKVTAHFADASAFEKGAKLATLQGDARDVLTCERTILNFLGRLCGIASWANQHVKLLAGLTSRLYDTRKTTPGWRRLEKYATRCGGCRNHRSGLYEAV
ncbi:MAG: nicotinate-nucleotide diphosphorylase (carboxylating), partial [Planctomycetota bacterium]